MLSTLNPAKSWLSVLSLRLCITMRYPDVVHINILLVSGVSLVRINPFVWNTRVYTKLFSVKLRNKIIITIIQLQLYRYRKLLYWISNNAYLLISQVYILPSNPLVNNRLSLGLYSMFLTQLECPWRVRILCFKFLASHRATVLSSEHVANIRWSRNLMLRSTMSCYMVCVFLLYDFLYNFKKLILRTSRN